MRYCRPQKQAFPLSRLSLLIHGLVGIAFVVSTQVQAKEYTFSASSLEGNGLSQQDIDLSLFSRENAQMPGTWPSRLKLNKTELEEQSITYISGENGELQAQITPAMLRQWGIKVDDYPELAAAPADTPLAKPLGHYIPQASATLDFSSMTLKISMPQAAISSQARDGIAPSLWDDGVPVLFTDYSYSGSRSSDEHNNTSESQYLNLRSGLNLGGWRLRNYSTWSQSENTHAWETINTYLEHDIDVLRSQFTVGENSTRGDVFDSIQYTGVNLASDDEMLPYSQRGYAPIIRGVASSNAEVSVRQNGYLIYQQNVAPGAFEITDLYSTTNSGDLEVTVKEADGSEHHFTQPYSSTAVMLRPGRIKYEATAARYRAASGSSEKEPEFAQASMIYGLNNSTTLFGGITASEDYQALNAGIGIVLGDFGALSADVTTAKATLDNHHTSTGQSYRLLYSGKIETTDTNFTLASYRYSTQGYYSFADANKKYDGSEDDWMFRYNKRNRIQASISQTLLGSSIYLNGYQQDYWGTSDTERSLSAGINTTIKGISYHLTYTYSKTSDGPDDRMIAFGLSIPLSRWLPNAWSSYNVSNSKRGYTRHNIGLNGTLLDDRRLSYSLQQSRSNHDADDTSSLYGSYRSRYANLNAGYYTSSNDSQQFSIGASGAIVAHPHGVTLSQPLGDQFAIVSAQGAQGIRFQNQRGIRTDWQGNAVIPSLSAYQKNAIRIDTTSLPDDVDTDATAVTVIPTRSAAVAANFIAHVGYRAMLQLSGIKGLAIPFGAMVSVDNAPISGIVDDTGTVYLAGVPRQFSITVKWGKAPEQQCHAAVALPEPEHAANLAGILFAQVACKQE